MLGRPLLRRQSLECILVKLVLALWGPDRSALLGDDLRARLRVAGATRLQVNLDDEHVPDEVLRLQTFEQPVTGLVAVWTDGSVEHVVDAVGPYADRVAGWEVEERLPLEPPAVPAGQRTDGLAQVALLRVPAGMAYDDWLAHWQGPHTQIAIDTQATFGYVQNRVVRPLTEDTPHVDAVVEELFPTEAMHDIHAYYGSGGDQAELDRRMTLLMDSVSTMGADQDLDLVATSRYVFTL
jgi:hypothetical protein